MSACERTTHSITSYSDSLTQPLSLSDGYAALRGLRIKLGGPLRVQSPAAGPTWASRLNGSSGDLASGPRCRHEGYEPNVGCYRADWCATGPADDVRGMSPHGTGTAYLLWVWQDWTLGLLADGSLPRLSILRVLLGPSPCGLRQLPGCHTTPAMACSPSTATSELAATCYGCGQRCH